MILFLHWVYKTYLTKKRKKGKRKSVNQYWRDFKMLYRRVNSTFINANDSNKVVKLTSYCFHQSTANTIDDIASDAVHNQIMRHDPFTGVFNRVYINNIIRFNVQNAFLENEISDNGLTRAFTHISIRYNPSVPNEVLTEIMNSLLTADPDIVDLE
ncbi:hypothetical protein OCU04_006091 [Sclerotinia nivalis]|uniref:Uncharacterized protein n=1 Tax=Sclerotinia nivalis TaxID=352851 RepID=A0A9X0DLT9_9HELO|nr:hypothetical protein OCU04_006091 [Sclerotinia nivalis]